MEENILAELNAVVVVSIIKVTPGSILVANSVAFIEADLEGAKANQDALTSFLQSADGDMLKSIYGTSFDAVTVSDVKQTTTPNPGDSLLAVGSTSQHVIADRRLHSV